MEKISISYSFLNLFHHDILGVEVGVDPKKGEWFLNLKGPLRDWTVLKHLNKEKNVGLDSRGRYWYSAFIPPFSKENPEVLEKFFRLNLGLATQNTINEKLGLKRKYVPQAATIAVTPRCNYNCAHCSFKKKNQGKEWNLESLKRVISQLLKMGTYNITLTGGEPLLYSRLEEIINFIDKKEAIVGMFTNGYFLNKKKAKSLYEAGLDYVFVSIDSPDSKEHNKNRTGRENSFAFERAIEAVKIAKKTGFVTGISTFMTPEKIKKGYLEKMYQLGEELNVDEIVYFDCVPAGNYHLMSRTQLLSYQDHKKLALFHVEKNKRGIEGPRATTQSYVNFSEWSGGRCYAFNYQCYIDPEGEMFGCDFQDFSIGNVLEIGVKEAFEKGSKYPLFNVPCTQCRKQSPQFDPIRVATAELRKTKKGVIRLEDIEEFLAKNYGAQIPLTFEELGRLRQKYKGLRL